MPFEVTFPFAVLPEQGSGYMTGPVSEADVKLPVKESKKPKKKKELPRRAYSGSPVVVSNGRGPQTVRGFQLPYEEEFDMREYGVSNGTGKGYEGPFVEDDGVEDEEVGEKVEGGARPDMSGVPGKIIKVEPGKDTWLSKMIRPDESELEAARNGLRWNWALEHRFMPPGSKWNETVWQGADRENRWLANMLKQKNGGLDVGIPTAATVRAREQSRRAIMDQYNKALAEYMKGHWDDPERAYVDFKKEVERLREQYRKAGEAYGAEFDPEDLRLPPPVAGSRSSFTTQVGPVKIRKNWNYANNVNNTLKKWIDSGKINDPEFMKSQSTKNYLDAVSETVVKYIKESSNTMADAEKKRLQILMLTDAGQQAVEEVIREYQKALAGVMSSASAKEWSQNNWGKVNEVMRAIGFTPGKTPKSLGEQIAAVGGIISSALSRNDELPTDIAADLEAVQSQFEAYMDNMMFAANVDPKVVAQMAKVLGDLTRDQYNDQAYASSRGIADKLGDIEDLTDKIPKDTVPLSPLLGRKPTFTWPSLNDRPSGKASTNPASVGESNPSRQVKPSSSSSDGGIVWE